MTITLQTFEDFGAIGDDASDDTAAINAALATGLPIYGTPGKTYRVSDRLDMADRTWLNLRGSQINCYGQGTYGLLPRNHCKVMNGKIVHYGTDTTKPGDYQAPICLGRFLEGDTYHDIEISGMELEAPYSWCITITGGCNNIVVENIKCSGQGSGAVTVHWGWVGGGNSGLTNHPHNITIRNVDCYAFNAANEMRSHIFWLSGCYNVLVENAKADQVGRVATVFCGDYGTTYTPNDEKGLICKGIVLRNIICYAAFAGVFVNGKPFISGAVVDMNATIEHIIAVCHNNSNVASRGILMQSARGVRVRGGCYDSFNTGAVIGGVDISKNSGLYGVSITKSNGYGVNVGTSTLICEDIDIDGCTFANNNQGGASGAAGAAILLSGGRRIKVKNNEISGASHPSGVFVSVAAVESRIRDNHVQTLAPGGVAYLMYAGARGSGNTAGPGVTLHSGLAISNS